MTIFLESRDARRAVIAIGRIEAGTAAAPSRGSAGSWGSPEDWAATHNG